MTILVTGAAGFIGQAVTSALISRHREVYKIVRSLSTYKSKSAVSTKPLVVGDIGSHTDWSDVLFGSDCIIHCATRAHTMNKTKTGALVDHRAVNVEGTKNLAEQAAVSGVKCFIFLSSIKVNGERTSSGSCFTSEDNAFPEDAYGISKWEAEQALHEVSARTGLEIVIIRPPLVYGPGVKGNFFSLLGWLSRGIPLPLGAIHNQRSLIGIDNLVDLIITCIDHPAAANQTFLVSDGEDLSTTELLRNIGKVLGKPARLLPVPSSLLQFGAQMLGKQDIAQRLLGNLQLDISHAKETLDWMPPISVDEGLGKTADWYLDQT